MAIYFIKVKGKEGYIKHEAQGAYDMYQDMEKLGYEVEEAFVVNDKELRWNKVLPKSTGNEEYGSYGGTITMRNPNDYEIDYELLAKELNDRLVYYLSGVFEITIDDYLIRSDSKEWKS